MILILHNYAHVFEVCDRVNLLQHGEITLDKPTKETSVAELTEPVVREYRQAERPAEPPAGVKHPRSRHGRERQGRLRRRLRAARGRPRVRASDLARGVFERTLPGEPRRVRPGRLAEAGDAFAIVRGVDAVVHAGAIPDPTKNPPHVVFGNNLIATFNVLEAAVRFGVGRFVYISSETIPGFFFPERSSSPTTCLSTRSTRSGRRTRTRSRSGSASC